MAKAKAKAKEKRPSSSSNPEELIKLLEEKASSSSNPEELIKLLEEEKAAPFNIGIEAIIQNHLQTLNKSFNRIQKLLQTSSSSSLIQSYKRLGRIHEVENDHVVFHDSSEALQKDIKSSIQVAQNITTIFQSILPRHTLDYASDRFFLVNFSKSEDLKVSKFQKRTDFVRNKIVELAVKLYNLRTSRLQRSIAESVQYGLFCKYGTPKVVWRICKNDTLENVDYIERILNLEKNDHYWDWPWEEEIITEERDERMMKIEEAMKDLEGVLFGIYVMVQTQAAISAYAISEKFSEKWSGEEIGGHHQIHWSEETGGRHQIHHDIKSLADAEKKKKVWWFKYKIISFTN